MMSYRMMLYLVDVVIGYITGMMNDKFMEINDYIMGCVENRYFHQSGDSDPLAIERCH